MGRNKRVHPLLVAARTYLSQHVLELKGAPLQMCMLDGPPGSPRCAVTAEACLGGACPYGVSQADARTGLCTARDCPLRCSVRLLLDRRGAVMQATRSGIHWN
ncbi:MAG TPA: hypothetical protein VKE41_09680 [Roseiflexaceae bacterium]|nr:hypothetical protein [Roseiflexaceae bacterium]